MRNLFILAAALIGTVPTWAVPLKVYEQKLKAYAYSYPKPASSALTLEKNSDAIKLIVEQEGNRKLASTISEEWFEAKMSSEFKDIRQAFLKIKTGEELDQKLAFLDKNFATLKETDSQFFVAQMIPLRSLRGMVWRLKPLVGDVKLAHSVVLTSVKNVFMSANLFFPTDQTVALTEYLTQPFVENGIAPWTRSGQAVNAYSPSKAGGEAELQAHFTSVVIPMIETAADRISKIRFSSDWRVFDNRLWYGGNSFPDAVDRYALVGEVERYVALANLYSAISTLSYQAAYSWNDFLNINVSMAQLYGWNSLSFEVDGVPLAKRMKVLKTNLYSQWGTLVSPDLMSKAWINLSNSVIAADNAWQGMKTRKVSEYTLVNNSMALPFQRPIDARVQGMKSLLEGESTVVSAITRESVKVNLKAFFDQPPQDLREMYPTGFVSGPQMSNITLKTTSGPSNFTYRNYLIGSGEHWDLGEKSVYQRLFPDLKKVPDLNRDQELKRHLRVLSQGWGTGMLASPLVDYFY